MLDGFTASRYLPAASSPVGGDYHGGVVLSTSPVRLAARVPGRASMETKSIVEATVIDSTNCTILVTVAGVGTRFLPWWRDSS
jgi:hypothetical protein